MKLRILLFVFVFVCKPVFAETAYFDKNTGFLFPASIADFSFSDKREYGDVELGYGLNYWDNDGTLITVIVYNYGISNIKDGIKGSHVISQYDQAQGDVNGAVKAGYYESAKNISVPQGFSSNFLAASYSIVRKDGASTRSHIFFRGQNGYFIKVRATGVKVENLDKKVAKFLDQLFVIVSTKKS